MAASSPDESLQSTNKCPRGTPTLLTPRKPIKIVRRSPRPGEENKSPSVQRSSRRQLTFASVGEGRAVHAANWSVDELKALVEYFHKLKKQESWPAHRNKQEWNSAACFLRSVTGTSRSGKRIECIFLLNLS